MSDIPDTIKWEPSPDSPSAKYVGKFSKDNEPVFYWYWSFYPDRDMVGLFAVRYIPRDSKNFLYLDNEGWKPATTGQIIKPVLELSGLVALQLRELTPDRKLDVDAMLTLLRDSLIPLLERIDMERRGEDNESTE